MLEFSWLRSLNLLHVFNWYLIVGFVASAVINFQRYRAVLGMVYRFPGRWPKLLVLVKEYRGIHLGWPTLVAIGLAFLLMVSNTLAVRLAWPQAKVTLPALEGHWIAAAIIALTILAMFVLDFRALTRITRFDREALEVKLDNAETWMTSWKSPAIRIVSFGFINPRKIVGVEIQRALSDATWVLIGGLRILSLRTAMQFAVGLSLWLTWFFVL